MTLPAAHKRSNPHAIEIAATSEQVSGNRAIGIDPGDAGDDSSGQSPPHAEIKCFLKTAVSSICLRTQPLAVLAN